ncbi:MAPEG family protein [Pelagibius sp. Alg239-R121]|uniref:MAPEG family protein n=1 Tax=Pelagibius sp. Alg239-R121 TaxID=2993448 RepID=UPI0024A63FD2|nr:MAPEG family protein [Pelagibius sp. Alg239-R121]
MSEAGTSITITAFYASLAAFLLVLLSIRVIRARRSQKVAIGDGEDLLLRRAMRVQANFTEYTPLALLLIGFAELQGAPAWNVHLLGAILIAARAVHAFGVGQEAENLRFRVVGMAATFFVLISGAIVNLGFAVHAWLL